MVTEVEFDEEESVISCSLEAVISKRSTLIQWQELKDVRKWVYGWK